MNSERATQRCGYCDTTDLVYELNEMHRGAVHRCLECLAIEQGQQQLRMPFSKFMDFDPGVVYDSKQDVLNARKHSYVTARAWFQILARIKDDEPPIKRDPDAIGTVSSDVWEFLTNLMGEDAHKQPSELMDR